MPDGNIEITCNQLVAGSSPAAGALRQAQGICASGLFCFICGIYIFFFAIRKLFILGDKQGLIALSKCREVVDDSCDRE
jgi:hypothetical protein